ncbi:MAG: YaaR family protein [Clostridiaceae bacterium]|nr:YaaR family protein [Clostridiaceae bacterium]
MKISDTLGNTTGLPGLPAKDDTRVKSGRGGEFRNQLLRTENSNYEQHLERLVQDIVRQGDILARKIDIRELKVYKKLIAEFLDLALGNSRKFSKRSLLDRRGRHKVFAIVKNINSELDLLTQDVLQGEKDNITLLQRLADIRGLILDLFM